ncbi:hypothetical protein LY474_40430 [Myxococcus stipitatus]|uniref:hypothetical protein n=1 Tax=Myxococcus stipitatus TaxID=83455 RepID=UPI001F2B917E|nr:hypothetical protein [Myxococcus stipitatus]MCE9674075.1 hypothetical protein [Myxococcus stipitatus]
MHPLPVETSRLRAPGWWCRALFTCVALLACQRAPTEVAGAREDVERAEAAALDPGVGVVTTHWSVAPEVVLDLARAELGTEPDTRPVVASGNTVYVVAWLRQNVDVAEVRFARVRVADDVVLGVGAFSTGVGAGLAESLDVAASGDTFLFVWEVPSDGLMGNVRGARVRGADGVLLDARPITVSDRPTPGPGPRVASNGTDFFVAWTDTTSSPLRSVRGARVQTSNGRVLDWPNRSIGTTQGLLGEVSVAHGDGVYFVAWAGIDQPPGQSRIRGVRVRSSNLTVLDTSPLLLSASASNQFRPAVTFAQGRFLVAWEDSLWPQGWKAVGRRVNPVNGVIDPLEAVFSADPTSRQMDIDLAATTGGTMAVWRAAAPFTYDPFPADVWATRLAPDGWSPLGSELYVLSATPGAWELHPSIAPGVDHYRVAWYRQTTDADAAIALARVELDGLVPTPERVVSPPAPPARGSEVAMASAGDIALVVWQDTRARRLDQTVDLLGARMRVSDGAVLDAEVLVIASDVRLEAMPSVATDGQRFLVAYESRSSLTSDVSIQAVRVNVADGAVLDAEPLSVCAVAGARAAPVVAFGDGYFLVAWGDFRAAGSGVYHARVRASDGVVLEPDGVRIPTSGYASMKPGVAYGGGFFLVAWNDSYQQDIVATRVRAVDGQAQDVTGIVLAQDSNVEEAPAIVFGGGGFLVAWRRLLLDQLGTRFIEGRRVRADDGGVDAEAEFSLGTVLESASPFALAFDGTRYLLLRERAAGAKRELVAARVSMDLRSTDWPGEVLVHDVRPQGRIAVTPGTVEGTFLVGYTDASAAPRVRVRRVSEVRLPQGTHCATAVECGSGFCVDGVCCDSACGDSTFEDCQACAVMAGAPADGVCGPVRQEAARVCRESAGACDVAETCDGVSTECPADALAEDGTSCDDLEACTQVDTCQSGVCQGSEPGECPTQE